jgi:hypothetical protein
MGKKPNPESLPNPKMDFDTAIFESAATEVERLQGVIEDLKEENNALRSKVE